MLKIDDNLLKELGLADLPLEEKDLLLSEIYQQLETRVGARIADGMSDAQLDEFGAFIDGNDEEGALAWLQKNFPDYPKVVNEELEVLKSELKSQAGHIKQAIADNPTSHS